MAVNITYMGTKRDLAALVAEVACQTQTGVLLDAFAGMCTVGEQVAPSRQIWSNDVQVFAAEVARALFTSVDDPPDAIWTADLHFDEFERHRRRLADKYDEPLGTEVHLGSADTFTAFTKRRNLLKHQLSCITKKFRRRNRNLFTTTYSDSYFGLRQAIDADAIVGAIAEIYEAGKTSLDQKRWCLLALGRALLKVANSTGHFAQFLTPNRSSFRRFCSQRKRDLWAEWLFSIGELSAVGTMDWRKQNKAFNEDSLALLRRLAESKERPSVIYADPPYTDDQYSRYYHILDTLMLYDYPEVTGAGLYRPARFSTPFSLKTKVTQAFDDLIKSGRELDADLILSYPSNGLIHEAGAKPETILKRHYGKVECCFAVPHNHSTFGASKGSAQANVTEFIYLAKS